MNKKSAHTKRAPKQKEAQGQSLHTPGPWEVDHDEGSKMPMVIGPVKENGRRDKVALFPMMMPNETAESNARMIAAAPELLEALQLMSDHYDDLSKSNPGFMGKLCLQNYELWNKALYSMERVLSKVTSVGRGGDKV